ncbi:MAG: hypothetical protein CL607_08230 [Anaerolineaceae bacterium]|nr:hypothetical protein [Anaerolineaceae bacterium]
MQAAISQWEDVTVVSHRFGGIEFRLGKVEIGHVHRDGLVDIPFTRAIREVVVAEMLAEPHHILPDTGWISFWVGRTGRVEQAIDLMRLSYLQKRSRREPAAAAKAETLPFSQDVLAAAFPVR